MGTDIHTIFQKRVGDVWENIPSEYEGGRHYDLFAHLAGVRNGTGFAGVLTGAPVKPIAEPRGYPEDFHTLDDYIVIASEIAGKYEVDPTFWEEDQTEPRRWMGYHNHSWLTGEEILSHDWGAKHWKAGVVGVEFFRQWDGITPPSSYSGDTWGGGVNRAENPCLVTPETTHVRIFWIADAVDDFSYFVNEVKRLVEEHGEIRMVFGFDS